MFKKGDIVVKTKTTNSTDRLGSKEGDIWKVNKLTKFTPNSAYYSDGSSHSSKVRKATPEEIKWFEAGITNINQIPEVGASFDFVDEEGWPHYVLTKELPDYDLLQQELWLKKLVVQYFEE